MKISKPQNFPIKQKTTYSVHDMVKRVCNFITWDRILALELDEL